MIVDRGRAAAEALDRELADRGCAALLVLAESAEDPDLAPFTGRAHLGRSLLIAPRGSTPALAYFTPMERDEAAATGLALLTPEALEVERLTRESGGRADLVWASLAVAALVAAGVAPGRVALVGKAGAGLAWAVGTALAKAGWTVVPGEEAALFARKGKPAWQLAEIRRCAAGAMAAYRRVAAALAAAVPGEGGALALAGEPLTAGRLRREIAVTLAEHGLDQPHGNIVAAGADAGVPHSAGADSRVLRAGEAILVDLYPKGVAWADCTRTFCVGPPPPALAAAHARVVEALALACERAAPGVRGFALQEAVCAHFQAAGHPTPESHPGTTVGYVHNLGHGVGFSLHEVPSFRKETGAEGLLAAGDVFTLEPGLYDPEGGWGVRVEDLFALSEGGLENLTPLPQALDPRAW